MADDEKGEAAEGGAAIFVGGDGLDWSCRMTEVQRIVPDPEDDEPDDLFTVTFAVDGPNANAEVEIMVTDAADIEVVAIALDTLHGALTAWADLIQRRKAELRAVLAEA